MSWAFLKSEWSYLTGSFITLLFMIDPFGMVPMYLALTDRFSEDGRHHIQMKSTAIGLLMLVIFAVSGMRLFELFGITLPAFQVAGGLLLLLIGVSQLNANRRKVSTEEADEGLSKDDISVFPLATPLLAGPGSISTVILLATKASSLLRLTELVLAIAGCMLVAFLIMRWSVYLHRALGNTGLNLLSRIMGIVLTAIAVQFILNGIKEAFPQLAL